MAAELAVASITADIASETHSRFSIVNGDTTFPFAASRSVGCTP